jgi:hypothetical protein
MPTGRGYALIFDTTITLFDQSFDSLELTMDVAWRPDLTVNALWRSRVGARGTTTSTRSVKTIGQ